MFGSILGAIAGPIIGGLFQNKANKDARKAQPTPDRNLLDQAKGAREASAKYGFNPLTMMQYGQTGGAGGVGPLPPLASVEMISSAIRDVSDVVSGDAARRRQQQQLELDLARLKVEQARSGVIIHPQNTVDNVGTGLSPLGRTTSTYAQGTVRHVTPPMATPAPKAAAPKPPATSGATANAANPIAPDRKRDVAEMTNSPGVFEVQNKVTGGKPITIPGDGEPWGADEVVTAVVVGAPQVFHNVVGGGKPLGERLDEQWTPDENSIIAKAARWWTGDETKYRKGKK